MLQQFSSSSQNFERFVRPNQLIIGRVNNLRLVFNWLGRRVSTISETSITKSTNKPKEDTSSRQITAWLSLDRQLHGSSTALPIFNSMEYNCQSTNLTE